MIIVALLLGIILGGGAVWLFGISGTRSEETMITYGEPKVSQIENARPQAKHQASLMISEFSNMSNNYGHPFYPLIEINNKITPPPFGYTWFLETKLGKFGDHSLHVSLLNRDAVAEWSDSVNLTLSPSGTSWDKLYVENPTSTEMLARREIVNVAVARMKGGADYISSVDPHLRSGFPLSGW